VRKQNHLLMSFLYVLPMDPPCVYRPVQDVGIIRVNSKEARELMRPCPTKCLETLARLLPRVAAYCNATLLAELNEALRVRGFLFPTRTSLSISFTRAQGAPKCTHTR
jgi:hypothetical protein